MKRERIRGRLAELRGLWERRAGERGALRTREAARELGCREADLVAAGVDSVGVWRLDGDRLLEWLGSLAGAGRWMWLLRNEWAVLEKVVRDVEVSGSGLEFCGEGMRVGVELGTSGAMECYLVERGRGPKLSVQFYTPRGEAVLKLYWKEGNRKEDVMRLLSPYCGEVGEFIPERAEADEEGESGRKAEEEKAERGVAGGLHREFLEAARECGAPVELVVRNRGAWMEVEHLPQKLVPMEGWFNILDRGLNLHLREGEVVETRIAGHPKRIGMRLLVAGGEEALRMTASAAVAECLERTRCGGGNDA